MNTRCVQCWQALVLSGYSVSSVSTVPECELEYDVFISYSSEDEDWVKQELLKNLEAEGYKVYIDFKDFVPGKKAFLPFIKESLFMLKLKGIIF